MITSQDILMISWYKKQQERKNKTRMFNLQIIERCKSDPSFRRKRK